MKPLNDYIDHTVLKADAVESDIIKLCKEARQNDFYAVCVNSCHVALAAEQLAGSSVKVASVVGFPLGAMHTGAKVCETEIAVCDGAREIDMVLNIGALKEGRYDYVKADIRAVVEAAAKGLLAGGAEAASFVDVEACANSTAEAAFDGGAKACSNGTAEAASFVDVEACANGTAEAASNVDAEACANGTAKAASDGTAIVKVILETCLLTDDEIVAACKLSEAAGAAFVKTSTGFSTGGATAHHVKLMKDTVGDRLKVKASGGIRTREKAIEMIEAGADRIGASASIEICAGD